MSNTDKSTDGGGAQDGRRTTHGKELEAVHLPGSETYHLAIDGDPICNMQNGKANTDRMNVATIDAAEQFFSRCETCKKSYNPELGMSKQEIADGIREMVGLDPAGNSQFKSDELVAVYKRLEGEKNE